MAHSEFGCWESFTTPSGPPGNLPDQPGSTTGGVFTQLNTNALLTGSSNIYNLSTSSFPLTDNTSFALGAVVLQTRTIGSELDYGSVSLVHSNDTGMHAIAPLFRYDSESSSYSDLLDCVILAVLIFYVLTMAGCLFSAGRSHWPSVPHRAVG